MNSCSILENQMTYPVESIVSKIGRFRVDSAELDRILYENPSFEKWFCENNERIKRGRRIQHVSLNLEESDSVERDFFFFFFLKILVEATNWLHHS